MNTKLILSGLFAACIGFTATTALGASRTWTGNGSGDNWNTDENWASNNKPVSTDNVIFNADAASNLSINDISGLTLNGVTALDFTAGITTTSYVLSGSAVQLGGTTLQLRNSSSILQTVNFDMELVGTPGNKQFNTVGDLAVGGVISGNGFGIQKVSAGQLILNNANTFNGQVTFSGGGGTVKINHQNAVQNAVLNLSIANPFVFGGGIGNFSAGGMTGGNSLNLVDEDSNPINFTVQGDGAGASLVSRSFSGSGSVIFSMNPGGLQRFNQASGTGSAGAWTGNMTINSGTVQLELGTALPPTGGMTINGGTLSVHNLSAAPLNINLNSLAGTGGTITTSGSTTSSIIKVDTATTNTWDGVINQGVAGTVSFTKTGVGSLDLTGSHGVTNGDFRAEGGTFTLSGTNALGSAVNMTALNAGTLLNITGTTTSTGVFQVQSNATLRLSNADALQNATLSHTTAGTVEFASGIGTFNVGGKIGALQTNLEDMSSNPITLVLQGDGNFVGSGTFDGAGALVVNLGVGASQSFTASGNPAGRWQGGTTINSGTLIASQNQIIPNDTALTINGGSLEMTTSTASNVMNLQVSALAGTGGLITYTTSGPGSFSNSNLTVNQNTNTTFSGVIDQNAASQINLVKNGSGSLTLEGDNIYSGTTSVNVGTLIIDGDHSAATGNMTVGSASAATLGGSGIIGGNVTIVGNGTLAPGNSPGVLTLNQNLTFNSGSAALFEIDGATRGTQYDGVNIGGALAYGGELTLDFGTTFGAGGFSFNLFDGFASQSSNFTDITLVGSYTGSMNNSGGGIWDLVIGDNTFQFSTSTGDLNLSVIPEPSSLVLLLAGGLVLGLMSQRSRRLL